MSGRPFRSGRLRSGGTRGGRGKNTREIFESRRLATAVLKQYDVQSVLVDCRSVIVPEEDKVRPTDQEKARQLYFDEFLNGGYGVNQHFISVAVVGEENQNSSFVAGSSADGRPVNISGKVSLQLLDGSHRICVLKDPEVLAAYPGGLVKAFLYTRKDRLRLSLSEMLVVGNAINVFSGLSIPMSTHDRMRLVLSFIKTSVGAEESPRLSLSQRNLKNNVRVKEIVAAVMAANLLPNMAVAQVRKYCVVAHGLFRFPERISVFAELMKKYSSNVTVCSLPTLWEAADKDRFHFQTDNYLSWEKYQRGVPKSEDSRAFLALCRAVYEGALTILEEKGEAGKSIFEHPVDPDASTSATIYEELTRRLVKVVPSELSRGGSIQIVGKLLEAVENIGSWNTKRDGSDASSEENSAASPDAIESETITKAPKLPASQSAPAKRTSTLVLAPSSLPATPEVQNPPVASRSSNIHDLSRAASVVPCDAPVSVPDPVAEPNTVPEVTPDSPSGPAIDRTPSSSSVPDASPASKPVSGDSRTGTENRSASVSNRMAKRLVPSVRTLENPDVRTTSRKPSPSGAAKNGERREEIGNVRTPSSPPLRRSVRVLRRSPEIEQVREEAVRDSLKTPAASRKRPAKRRGRRKKKQRQEEGDKSDVSEVLTDETSSQEIILSEELANGYAVEEEPDTEGFRVIQRSKVDASFLFEAPSVRKDGFDNVEKRDSWYEGTLEGKSSVLALFNDFVSPVVRCQSPWRLAVTSLADWHWQYSMPESSTCGMNEKDDAFCKEGVLRSFGMRPPHRTHFHLLDDDVKYNRGAVVETALGLALKEATPTAGKNTLFQYTTWSKIWMSQYFFRSKRRELDSNGFVTIEGMMKTNFHKLDDLAKKHEKLDPELKKLWDWVSERIPTSDQLEENRLSEEQKKMFYGICNRDLAERDSLQTEKNNTRLSTSGWALNEHLEELSSFDLIRARCRLDIWLSQIASFLHLEFGDFDDYGSENTVRPPALMVPDSGGRFLATLSECSDQVPHTDFPMSKNLTYPEVDYLPSYFMIATGEEESVLAVLPHSHKEAYNTEGSEKEYAKHAGLTVRTIPAHSVFIGRGDLIHAGTGSLKADKRLCLRYHMYLQREGMALADAIHTKKEFKFV